MSPLSGLVMPRCAKMPRMWWSSVMWVKPFLLISNQIETIYFATWFDVLLWLFQRWLDSQGSRDSMVSYGPKVGTIKRTSAEFANTFYVRFTVPTLKCRKMTKISQSHCIPSRSAFFWPSYTCSFKTFSAQIGRVPFRNTWLPVRVNIDYAHSADKVMMIIFLDSQRFLHQLEVPQS